MSFPCATMGADQPLDTQIARHVWQTRYRAGTAEASVQATWRRVAHALAEVEVSGRVECERRFLDILQDFQFLPGGRIQAGAGTDRDVTLFNCFHGHDRGLDPWHLPCAGGGCRDDAARWWCRLRFLDDPPERRSLAHDRCHRFRSGFLHGCLGCHVRHHPIHRSPPRPSSLNFSASICAICSLRMKQYLRWQSCRLRAKSDCSHTVGVRSLRRLSRRTSARRRPNAAG